MAKKTEETEVSNVANEQDDLAMPEEFDADEPEENLSIDAILGSDADQGHNEEVRKLTTLPYGDWEKEDRFDGPTQTKEKISYYAADKQDGDFSTKGRMFLNFSGRPKPRTENGIEYAPVMFIRISPDLRFKKDQPNVPDLASKLYSRAMDTFLAVNDRVPKTKAELCKFLEEDHYVFRTMNGDSGPIILDIKPKRVKR